MEINLESLKEDEKKIIEYINSNQNGSNTCSTLQVIL